MTTTYTSANNGASFHYYANSGEPCHPCIIAGNYVIDDVTGERISADIIQLDAISLGVIVPLRRNAVDWNPAIDTNGTYHRTCTRG